MTVIERWSAIGMLLTLIVYTFRPALCAGLSVISGNSVGTACLIESFGGNILTYLSDF